VRITACGLAMTVVAAPALVFWATRDVQRPSSAVESKDDAVRLAGMMSCGSVNCLWRSDLSCDEVPRYSANYRCCCDKKVNWWEKQGRITVGRDQKKCLMVQFMNEREEQLRKPETHRKNELLSTVDHLIASEGVSGYLLSTTTVTTTRTMGVLVLEDCEPDFDPLAVFDMTQGLPHRERMVRLEADRQLCWKVVSSQAGPFVELGGCNYETKQNRFMPPGISPGLVRWAANPSKCLDTSDAEDANHERVVRLRDCNASSPQQVLNVPQAAFETEAPSLFCVSLMLPRTGEETLLKAQLKLGMVGIFGCNEWSIYSNESRLLSIEPPVYSENVMNGSLWCAFGGQWHSALNTPIFLRFWHAVLWDQRAWDHDWILKADPDTVFFPQRLRPLLRKRWWGGVTEGPTYLSNCDLGSHGPLTILNTEALALYKREEKTCASPFSDSRQQEDLWFRACLEHLGVRRVNAYNLLWEKAWACTEPPSWGCQSNQVAFHPYKNAQEWETCYWIAKDVGWDNDTIMSIAHGS